MPRLIELPTHSDARGNLTVLENVLPFDIKRVFFIHSAKGMRGGHGHKETKIALVALSGSVEVFCQSPHQNFRFLLDTPDKCLLLNPEDWHTMDKFSENVTLLALASHPYDKDDYFFEKYR